MKKTKVEMLNEMLEAYDFTEEHEALIQKLIEQANRKNTKSNTMSEEMLATIEDVKDFLTTGRYTAIEVSRHMGWETSQKAVGILNKIVRLNAKGEEIHPESNVEYVVEKGKKYFYIAS